MLVVIYGLYIWYVISEKEESGEPDDHDKPEDDHGDGGGDKHKVSTEGWDKHKVSTVGWDKHKVSTEV